ncbi:hypothetical protein [Nostoc sp. C052]|nr:hypothetical protein [Nostoc sp. C052]
MLLEESQDLLRNTNSIAEVAIALSYFCIIQSGNFLSSYSQMAGRKAE